MSKIPFEQMVENVESAIEAALRDDAIYISDKAGVLFERMTGVMSAIDDWRQG